MNIDRQEEIKELAEFVAASYWVGDCLSIERILEANDIDLYEDHFGSEFDGVLEYVDERFSIFLNIDRGNSLSQNRGRFTVGHELGHYYIDEHRQPMEKGLMNPHPSQVLKSDLPMEKEADWFSCNLLMPENIFKKVARKNMGLEGVKLLGEKFRVSLTSAAIRYVSLMLSGAALILWRDGVSQWCITSEDYHLTIYKGRTVSLPPEGSATAEIINSGNMGDVRCKGTVLSEWKSRVSSWSYHNEILIEEALHLGKYGILTLLEPNTKRIII